MHPVDLIVPLAMGFGLAACAGLRAWLPFLILGGLARFGYLELHPSFQFLERTDVLMILMVATILEILGDKIVFIDHVLDVAGTVIRPAVGSVLTASLLVHLPLRTAILLGVMVGGSAAFSTHAMKSFFRTSMTMMTPFHGGGGNMVVSFGEDLLVIVGIGMAILIPLVFLFLVGMVFYYRWRRWKQQRPVVSRASIRE